MAIPGSVHNIQKCARSVSNECTNETDTLCQDGPPGRALPVDLPDRLKGVECNWDPKMVVEDTNYNGIHPRPIRKSVMVSYLDDYNFLIYMSCCLFFPLGLTLFTEDQYTFSLGPHSFSLSPIPLDNPTPVPALLFDF